MSWLKNKEPLPPQPAIGAAAAPPRTFSPVLEKHARASGFRNAEQMLLWSQQRQQATGGVVSGAAAPHTAAGGMHAAMAWHPANIFNYISEALRNANGGD